MFNRLFSTTVALTVLGTLVALPGITQTPPRPVRPSQQQVNDAPEIDSFTVSSIDQLSPGTELVFTLQGTPNAQATFTIGDLARNIAMREVESGVYEGRYVIRNNNQITASTIVRANLQHNNQVVSTRLPEALTSYVVSDRSQNSQSRNQQQQALYIDRLTMQPVQQLEPGTTLNITLIGTPNADATFSIEGITYNQPMRETSSGTYQGQYVIRRQDNIPSGITINAALEAGTQIVRARLDQDSVADSDRSTTTQLPLEILSPANNSRVSGTVEVRGRTAPDATVNVNVQASNSLGGVIGVNRNIVDRTVEPDAQGNFRFTFDPSLDIPGTRYQISLSATQGEQNNEETLVLIQE